MRLTLRHLLALLGVASIVLAIPPTTATAAAPAAVPGTTVADVQPTAGQTVGVAMPITVSFTGPVADRRAAEKSIQVVSPAEVTGTYTWLSDRTVQFTADQYWPAHSTVQLLAGGMPRSFEVGAYVSAVADISAYTFTVSIDGEVARQMPASMGKAKFPTPQGRFTVLEKQNPVIMDSRTIGIPLEDPEGYKLTVNYAVRITWGGVYVHSAPWSVGSQGYANVSHGCINLSPDNAAWYYSNVGIGDPVTVQA